MSILKRKDDKKENQPSDFLRELESANVKNKELINEIAQLKAIQSAMPDPYYIRDMDYNIIFWPDSIAKLMGYSACEAKKLKCYEIFKACVCPPQSDCPTQRCLESRQFLKDVAVDVYHKSGATIHSLVSNAGIYDENGNPTGAVEIVKDNTIIKNSMDSIGQIITKIGTISETLKTEIYKTQTISEKVNEQALESLNSIMTGVKAGNSVSEKADYSSKYAVNLQTTMKTVNESMGFSIGKIAELKSKSETIIEFIKVIQDIAAKTNLLAINASIEAAHAGESGKGFKVVADGIRDLSKNSNESAQSINSTIQEIIGLVKESTNSLNITGNDITTGTNNISELLTFVTDIDDSSKVLLNILDLMEKAAAVTSRLGEEQNETVIELEKVIKNLIEIELQLREEFMAFKQIQNMDMG